MSSYRRYTTQQIVEHTGLRDADVRAILKATKLTGRFKHADLHDPYVRSKQPRWYITQRVYDDVFAPIEARLFETQRIEAEAERMRVMARVNDRMSRIEARQAERHRAAQRELDRAINRAQRRVRHVHGRRPPPKPAYRLRKVLQ